MTIVEFLSARLAEAEQAAYEASPATGGPPRALADVEAKRRILHGYNHAYRSCVHTLEHCGRAESNGAWSALHTWRRAVECLAAIYDDHPDYDPSWKVGAT
ncbi:hypothetical protein CDO52_26380 [Nocardiopsis gilva YIM 90087]|uniref:Uncharacterized protein n=1 Tax=Nocardiopsis gilva YIM 90087 TaxID=1235441 RepID=A0A223SCH9_9ACTN|nr:DUF6221 family protein [Nocardiopsis gilva]ASU85858.1 hypothetical protein CDO52_26380 [Nocardiopsis gilva YIM 90087]